MKDYIFINELKIETIIGVAAWEREITQLLRLNLRLEGDFAASYSSDNIKDTINYDSVCQTLSEFIGTSKFELIEAVAFNAAKLILQQFKLVEAIEITVIKPEAVANTKEVGVVVNLNRTILEKAHG